MNNEYYSEPPDALSLEYLNEGLVNAIDNGDPDEISAALRQQAKNEVTVALSNCLVARSFLVRQKSRLVILEDELSDGASDKSIIDLMQLLMDIIKDDYSDAFVSVRERDRYDKLSGDEAFREFIAMDDDEEVDDEGIDNEYFTSSVTEAKFRLIGTTAAFLDSPEATFYWIQDLNEDIVCSLHGILEDIEKNSITEQNFLNIRQEISTQIDCLDQNILSCFP